MGLRLKRLRRERMTIKSKHFLAQDLFLHICMGRFPPKKNWLCVSSYSQHVWRQGKGGWISSTGFQEKRDRRVGVGGTKWTIRRLYFDVKVQFGDDGPIHWNIHHIAINCSLGGTIMIPTDNSENKRKRKYWDLAREVKKTLWNKRVKVISIEVGVLGTVSRKLKRALEELELSERIETILTTALLRSPRMLRRVLETGTEL